MRATKEKKRRLGTTRVVVERIILSERDTERILKILASPPEPPPALLAAAKRRHSRSQANAGSVPPP
ncbi:MAG: DUF1778 domain-containing protein [Alphaproteobacteria bacterium]|nr:DUF1778 domain-containing protein [Alphaproteobacteria bacterium]